jgi:adenine-specific DNA-methyltransferase
MPPLSVLKDELIEMSSGFRENLQYFRLSFLDPTDVELGKQFDAILPILWVMAGAKAEIQTQKAQPFLLCPDSNFAVLLQERSFRVFKKKLDRTNVDTVFLVTDSSDAFMAMKSELSAKRIVQLYKNYLENFTLNGKVMQ